MTPDSPSAENKSKSLLKAAVKICLACRLNIENASRIGVAIENLVKARVTGEISLNARRMKMNEPAQITIMIVRKTNEINLG